VAAANLRVSADLFPAPAFRVSCLLAFSFSSDVILHDSNYIGLYLVFFGTIKHDFADESILDTP
jgi:hypothetical protein